MRAQTQAHTAPVPTAATRALLGHVVVAICATVLLLLVWHPRVVQAQTTGTRDTTSRKHVVRPGETLWSLATRYYGDGHAWRALAKRNGIPTAGDGAVIRVGMTLSVPPKSTVTAAAEAAAKLPMGEPETPPVATAKAAPPDSATLAKAATARATAAAIAQDKANAKKPATLDQRNASDSSAIAPRSGLSPQVKAERLLTREPARLGIVDDGAARASRKASEDNTVFYRQVVNATDAEAMTRAVIAPAAPAPRFAEYLGAPYPVLDSQWETRGRVVRRIDAVGPALHSQLRLQLADEVEITLPEGSTAAPGDKLVVLQDGGAFSSGTKMGIPSGVLEVSQRSNGQTARAIVKAQTGVMAIGDGIFAIEGTAAPLVPAATALATSDLTTQVVWVETGTLIPSLQNFVMLKAGSSDGVSAGDEFELVAADKDADMTRVAVVRVVRTGAHGSAAVVVKQSRPDIAVGLTARRSAKTP
jgi:hypothetical protein